MEQLYIEEQTFEKIDFSREPLKKGEYEGCSFKYCDFGDSDLKEVRFIDCVFLECNLSTARLHNTALQDIQFNHCKLLGIHFEECKSFGFAVKFKHCQLDHSTFYQVSLAKAAFSNCRLHEVDFTESNLSEAIFQDCDFLGATFENTILEKADLRSSFNFTLDPEANRLKGAKFSLPGVVGLLTKYGIAIE